MKKLESLRIHLLSIPTELKIEPEDLLVFADNGKIISSSDGTNQHYDYEYKANIIITNYSGNFDQLTFWVLSWLKDKQPNHEPDPINFEADIINTDSVDLSITLNLAETIKTEQTEDGLVLHHVDDPDTSPVLLPAPDWTLSSNGDPLADWVQNG